MTFVGTLFLEDDLTLFLEDDLISLRRDCHLPGQPDVSLFLSKIL